MGEYKTSASLQTKVPSVSSVTLGLSSDRNSTIAVASDPSEARFWTQHFGLGNSTYSTFVRRKYAHPHTLKFKAYSNAIVNQLAFGPAVSSSNNNNSSSLAVVSGPRVSLYYGPAFVRELKSTTTTVGDDETSSSVSVTPDRNVVTGGHPALCAAYRNDGRLIAIGTTVGHVRICNATSRATLCTFSPASLEGQQQQEDAQASLAVRTVSWLRNGKQVLSGGDDGVLRLWSLHQATSSTDDQNCSLTLRGHGDSIRCAVVWQTPSSSSSNTMLRDRQWRQLAMSGSYDHTIRIWNIEQNVDNNNASENESTTDGSSNRCLAILQHGAPVEALLLQPNYYSRPHGQRQQTQNDLPTTTPWLLSAGGTTIKVWNTVSATCVCTLSTLHSKTITSLLAVKKTTAMQSRQHQGQSNALSPSSSTSSSSSSSWRILTAGLDGLVRIHTWNDETGQVKYIHGVNLGNDPITCMAINEAYNRLVFGTSTGYVLVKEKRSNATAIALTSKRKRQARAGTYAYFTRGMNVSADEVTAGWQSDLVLAHQEKKRKLSSFDLALRQFRYGDALDDALNTRQPQSVVAVLEELGKRRGLTIALSNRDEETLEPILSFTVRYITRPQFSSLLIGVSHKLCDIYGGVAGQSETIDELFDKLRNQVKNECHVQKSLLRIVGQLDAIMTVTEMEDEREWHTH